MERNTSVSNSPTPATVTEGLLEGIQAEVKQLRDDLQSMKSLIITFSRAGPEPGCHYVHEPHAARSSEVSGPPVWFQRVPRLVLPPLEDAESKDSTPAGQFELLMDSVFQGSDDIYESTIKEMKRQLIELSNRNAALELNLDVAEKELDYWRSSGPVSGPEDGRKISEKVWKHAVAKFVGSFDQFSMLRVLVHWRDHVRKVKLVSSN